MQNHNIKYRPDIDGLRAIAVLSVVLFHLFPNRLPGGFIGVDVFFVISGYLITQIIYSDLLKNQFSFQQFYIRRIKRIFPSLIVTLIITTILGYHFLNPDLFSKLGKHITSSSFFYSNFTLLNEINYFDQNSKYKPLLHIWSLAIEEQFYLFWPILLFASYKLFRKKIILVLSVLAGISLYYCIQTSNSNVSLAYYMPQSRMWELAIGGIVSFKNNSNRVTNPVFSLMGLVLIIFSFFIINEKSIFPGSIALLPVVGTYLVLISNGNHVFNTKLLGNKILVWIGLISYPIYLLHWPLISFAHINSSMNGIAINNKLKLMILMCTIIGAWIIKSLIEDPIRKSKQNKKVTILLLSTMLIVGMFGLFITRSNGFSFIYPAEIKKYIQPIDFQFDQNARFGICHYETRGYAPIRPFENEICLEKKRPLLVLWGDSYAAALYPGLRSIQNKFTFGIAQFTQCGTPPFLNVNWNNGCRTFQEANRWNQNVLEYISKAQPEYVLLHSVNFINIKLLYNELKLIAPKIKSISKNTKIVVIGYIPMWGNESESLSNQYFRYYKKFLKIPEPYTKVGLVDSVQKEPTEWIDSVSKLGVKYISAYDALCNENGCLSRVDDTPDGLIVIDQGHLSKKGSEYLIHRISKQIFN